MLVDASFCERLYVGSLSGELIDMVSFARNSPLSKHIFHARLDGVFFEGFGGGNREWGESGEWGNSELRTEGGGRRTEDSGRLGYPVLVWTVFSSGDLAARDRPRMGGWAEPSLHKDERRPCYSCKPIVESRDVTLMPSGREVQSACGLVPSGSIAAGPLVPWMGGLGWD